VGGSEFAKGLAALAAEDVVLTPRDFVALIKGADAHPQDVGKLAAELPNIYGRLVASGKLPQLLSNNPFAPARRLPSRAQRDWAEKCAATHSLQPERMRHRAALMTIRGGSIHQTRRQKAANDASGEAFKLAGLYALYKLAYLASKSETEANMPLTCEVVVRQNYR
jgi:hypothetical protein